MKYEDIADELELDFETKIYFVFYMRSRWYYEEELQCKTGYALEWAERFKMGIEYGASDIIGQTVLRGLGENLGFYGVKNKYTKD